MIKNHIVLGNNIIKYITNDEKIIFCVRNHHERWDGKGTQFDPELVDIIVELIE